MKHALVTGASTGIGRAIAIALAKEGIFVLITARNKENLEETKKLIEEVKGKADIIIADLANKDSLDKLISEIKTKTTSLDMLVNVAGIWHGNNEVFANKDFTSFSTQVVLDTFNVGIIAPVLLTHGLVPLMPENGKIVNISGTFENGAKGWLPYYVSKRAIEDLTIGLSQELSDKKIQVNCISPSDTATEQYRKYFPQYISDAIDPEEIAKEVVHLCSDRANNITGKVFVIKKGKEPFESFHF